MALDFAINNETIQGGVPVPPLTNQPPFTEVGIMAESSIAYKSRPYRQKYTENDLIGRRFGRLMIMEEILPKGVGANISRMMSCQCDCGNTTEVHLSNLLHDKTKSCGCYRDERTSAKNTKHGLSNHPLQKIRGAMKRRCLNYNDPAYYRYGGRGITVCNEWKNDFKAFYDWAIGNGWEKGLDIDRIDNDLGYSESNCRFVTKTVSSQNTKLLRTNNTSGYRGIWWEKRNEKWRACVQCDNKTYSLGYHKTKEEAARAYDAKVKELGSEHPLNFPD